GHRERAFAIAGNIMDGGDARKFFCHGKGSFLSQKTVRAYYNIKSADVNPDKTDGAKNAARPCLISICFHKCVFHKPGRLLAFVIRPLGFSESCINLSIILCNKTSRPPTLSNQSCIAPLNPYK
ncbi:MAG: hypothetical protein FWD39_01200, partial [Clostridiales bacterium]|nr:hypothetical protein [Clostridiales bacterium]